MIPYYQSVAARSDDTEFVKKIWDALNSLEKIGALRDTIDFKIETDLFVRLSKLEEIGAKMKHDGA